MEKTFTKWFVYKLKYSNVLSLRTKIRTYIIVYHIGKLLFYGFTACEPVNFFMIYFLLILYIQYRCLNQIMFEGMLSAER